MYGGICIVGERGQVTIPKIIRELGGIKSRDRLLMKMERKRIVIEKESGVKRQAELIKEFSLKYARLNAEVNAEWEATDADEKGF
ncbi:MAG: AbrB/MazE/SpoVT family DNA-binding domain-containing protein [Candidatus Micrarchaeota archaeon]